MLISAVSHSEPGWLAPNPENRDVFITKKHAGHRGAAATFPVINEQKSQVMLHKQSELKQHAEHVHAL